MGSESFQQIPQDVQAALRSVQDLGTQISVQLESSGPQLDLLLAEATATMSTANRELPEITAAAKRSLVKLEEALAEVAQAADELEGLVSADSPTTYQLNEALKELAAASRSIKLLTRSLEEQPEALIKGRSDR